MPSHGVSLDGQFLLRSKLMTVFRWTDAIASSMSLIGMAGCRCARSRNGLGDANSMQCLSVIVMIIIIFVVIVVAVFICGSDVQFHFRRETTIINSHHDLSPRTNRKTVSTSAKMRSDILPESIVSPPC